MNSRNTRKAPAGVFVALAIVIFFLTLSAADSVGFVPNYIDGTAPQSDIAQNDTSSDTSSDTQSNGTLALSQLPQLGEVADASVVTALPARVEIPAIDLDLAVQNPSTTNIDKLDALLQNGPARYTDSAKLGEKGNMIIFAHSSHLPIVHNQMFKAFNRIPELQSGDSITIVGDDGKNYMYTVDSVVKADTDSTIDMSAKEGTKLTLVTCDTLTGKSARFILTADFVGVVGE
jgi:LPXTG-site transpeptidase (sortase) family protein